MSCKTQHLHIQDHSSHINKTCTKFSFLVCTLLIQNIYTWRRSKTQANVFKFVSKNKIAYKHGVLEHNQPTPNIEFVRVYTFNCEVIYVIVQVQVVNTAEMVHIWGHWVFVEFGGMNCHHNCLPLRGRSQSKSPTKSPPYQVIFHSDFSHPWQYIITSCWQEKVGFWPMDKLIHHPWQYEFTYSQVLSDIKYHMTVKHIQFRCLEVSNCHIR